MWQLLLIQYMPLELCVHSALLNMVMVGSSVERIFIWAYSIKQILLSSSDFRPIVAGASRAWWQWRAEHRRSMGGEEPRDGVVEGHR